MKTRKLQGFCRCPPSPPQSRRAGYPPCGTVGREASPQHWVPCPPVGSLLAWWEGIHSWAHPQSSRECKCLIQLASTKMICFLLRTLNGPRWPVLYVSINVYSHLSWYVFQVWFCGNTRNNKLNLFQSCYMHADQAWNDFFFFFLQKTKEPAQEALSKIKLQEQ